MAVYYVSSLASGSGDGSLANPWTIDQSLSAVAGSEIRLIADGIYNITTTLSWTAIGTATAFNKIIGCNASGVVDGTKAVLSAQNAAISIVLFLASQRLSFKYIKFLDCASQAVYGQSAYGDPSFCAVTDCEFINCYTGIQLPSAQSSLRVIGCLFSGCTLGIGSSASGRHSGNIIYESVFIANDTGLYLGSASTVNKCIFIRNNYGFRCNTNFIDSVLSHNTFFGNTADAIRLITGARFSLITNSIFRNNGGYGINADADCKEGLSLSYNCFSNNTSGPINLDGGVPWGEGHIFTDPLFISEVPGSEDLRLQSASPCTDAGSNPVGY
jgi:hypothetical protein